MNKAIFNRTTLLFGEEKMSEIYQKKVIIFGVGGVGSWCAESLIRSGISHLTIVDSDRVCITNINRQLQTTTKTIGKVKVDILKDRLLEINPDAEIVAKQEIYSAETASLFNLQDFDYVIDAIDSLENKAELIRHATSLDCNFFSSMGAALKTDPTKVRVDEFWKIQGCPLARALRQKFKRSKKFPAKKFLCVYSPELLENKGKVSTCGTDKCMCPKTIIADGNPSLMNHEWCSSKAQINGTTSHITAIFGFFLAGLVINDIVE